MHFRSVLMLGVTLLAAPFVSAQYIGAGGLNYKNVYGANMSLSLEGLRMQARFFDKFGKDSKPTTKPDPKAPDYSLSGKYKPTEELLTIDNFLDAAKVEPVNRESTKKDLTDLVRTLQKSLASDKVDDDLFGALSLFICVNHSLATDKPAPKEAISKIYNQLRSALGSKEIKSMSDSDKQTLSESFILLSCVPILASFRFDLGNAKAEEAARTLAKDNLKNVLGMDAKKFAIDKTGLKLAK